MTVEEHIQQAYNEFEGLEVPETLRQTFAIFKTVLGEDKVDMTRSPIRRSDSLLLQIAHDYENPGERLVRKIKESYPFVDIIIWYPHETVTNETGNTTEVYDLFVKIQLMYNGKLCGNPRAIRATFTDSQLYSGYIHSHIPSLDISETGIQQWKSMCFGYGPLSNTLIMLRAYEPTDAQWIGFLSELHQWTRVESVEGGPHFRMQYISKAFEEIKKVNIRDTIPDNYILLIRSYIRTNRIKLGFLEGRFVLGMSFTDWLIDFSNYARAWMSANNAEASITFVNTVVKNNKIFDMTSSRRNDIRRREEIQRLLGRTVLTFKGQEIPLKMLTMEADTQNMSLIPYVDGVKIVKEILNIINTYYATADANIPQTGTVPIFWG